MCPDGTCSAARAAQQHAELVFVLSPISFDIITRRLVTACQQSILLNQLRLELIQRVLRALFANIPSVTPDRVGFNPSPTLSHLLPLVVQG